MRPQPLRVRILAALELAPMTIYDLARCLCASTSSIEEWVYFMRRLGAIETAGRVRTAARHAANLFRIAA